MKDTNSENNELRSELARLKAENIQWKYKFAELASSTAGKFRKSASQIEDAGRCLRASELREQMLLNQIQYLQSFYVSMQVAAQSYNTVFTQYHEGVKQYEELAEKYNNVLKQYKELAKKYNQFVPKYNNAMTNLQASQQKVEALQKQVDNLTARLKLSKEGFVFMRKFNAKSAGTVQLTAVDPSANSSSSSAMRFFQTNVEQQTEEPSKVEQGGVNPAALYLLP